MYKLSNKWTRIANSIVNGKARQSDLPKLPVMPKKDQAAIADLQGRMTGDVMHIDGTRLYKRHYKGEWDRAHWMDDDALVALATHPELSSKRDTLRSVILRNDKPLLKGYARAKLGHGGCIIPLDYFDALYIGKGSSSTDYVQYVFKNNDGDYQSTDDSESRLDPLLMLSAIERGINVKWTDHPDLHHLYEMTIKPINFQQRMIRQRDEHQVLNKAKVETELYPDKPQPSAVMSVFVMPVYGEASNVEQFKYEIAILLDRVSEELGLDENIEMLDTCINRINDLSEILLRTHADQNRQ